MNCDGCSRAVKGVKYRCLVCEDSVFCQHCQRGGIHGHHTIVEAKDVRSRNLAKVTSIAATMTAAALLGPNASQEAKQTWGNQVSLDHLQSSGSMERWGSVRLSKTPTDPLRQSTISLPNSFRHPPMISLPNITGSLSPTNLPYDIENPSAAGVPYENGGGSTASLPYDDARSSTESLPYGIVPMAPPMNDVVRPKVGRLPLKPFLGNVHQTQPPSGSSSNRKSPEKRHTVLGVTSADETGHISPEIEVKVAKPFKETASPPKARNPVAVRKIHVASDEYTLKWAPENSSAPYNRVKLSASDDEFKRVIQNMDQMGGMKYKNKVAMISRIENHGVYKTYSSCRGYLKILNDTGAVIERTLWHGTSADALTNIYRGGFNRGYCGKNATAYGDGVYFATSFDYSASPVYSPPDIKGQKYIFQCRVLTGQFSKGSQGLIEPPMRTEEFRFDSVVDDVLAPTMFIVFKDMQVYPEYVITLKL